MVLVSLAVALDSRGPVLFRQQRTGRDGKTFAIFKFRSMRVWRRAAIVRQAREGDVRITRVGSWSCAALSLDELPQLFNVLAGEMSLVGPRPHAVAHDEYYAARIANYAPAPAGQARHHRLGPGQRLRAAPRRSICDMQAARRSRPWYVEQ